MVAIPVPKLRIRIQNSAYRKPFQSKAAPAYRRGSLFDFYTQKEGGFGVLLAWLAQKATLGG